MVSHLIRLRYRLMWNGFRRSLGTMIGAIFSTLGFLYFIVMIYLPAFFVAGQPQGEVSYTDRGAVVVLVGAVALIVWVLGPILFSASNPFTNVRNFLTFGIAPREFISGVTLSGLLAPTGVGTLVLLLAAAVVWGWHPAAILAGIIAAVLGTVLCLLAMQVVVGLLTNVIAQRRVRDMLQMIMLVPLMLAGFILFGAIETIQEFWDVLPRVATGVAFSPLGFLALPWFVVEGQWGLAAAHLVVMCTWVALGLWAYSGVVARATATAGTAKDRRREQAGLGLLARAKSPAQAIWARSLLYWIKDPRYAASLIIVAVFILFGILESTVLQTTQFEPFTMMIPVVIAYLVAFSISADLSYDSTGFSLHVTSGVSGIDDRLGRSFALLTWALPLIIMLTVAMTVATDAIQQLPAWLGLNIGVLLSGTGLSSVLSARYIYPVPPPGSSLMAQPEGGMGRTMVIQTLGMLAQLVIALPILVPAVVAFFADSQAWAIITLMIGVLYGAGILWAGVRLGAKWYEKAMPETYQSIVKVAALY